MSIARRRRIARLQVERLDGRWLPAPIAPGAALVERVDSTVELALAQTGIPGIGVAVTFQDQVLLAKGYGLADVEARTPVSAETPFGIGSVTKTLTALAVLRIYDDPSLIVKPGIDRLELDVPIRTYLTDGPGFTLPEAFAPLTTRQLLLMSAGALDSGDGRPWYIQVEETGRKGLQFSPGTAYLYSNINYDLLGALVQQLTETTYAEFIEAHVFAPLGMTGSRVLASEATSVPGEAVGYERFDPESGRYVRPASSSSGVSAFSAGAAVSTAVDLGKYMAGLYARKLLTPTAYALMWQPVPLPSATKPGRIATPGLGWSDGDGVVVVPGGFVINKDGAVPGFSAQVTIDFADGLGVAVAYNISASGELHPNAGVAGIIGAIFDAITTATVAGTAYEDLDGSGTFDAGDRPLAGTSVYLDANGNSRVDAGEASARTGADGGYAFTRGPSGAAVIRVAVPGGYVAVTPVARSMALGPSQTISGQDFGFSRPTRVSGVTRVGRGAQTRLVLSFSGALAPDGAADPANYAVVVQGRLPRPGVGVGLELRVVSAQYDSASHTITLRTRHPFLMRRALTVRVAGANLRNPAGVPVDATVLGLRRAGLVRGGGSPVRFAAQSRMYLDRDQQAPALASIPTSTLTAAF